MTLVTAAEQSVSTRMPHILGAGAFRYRLVEGWPRWTPELESGVVSAIATDSADRVHVVMREPNPVVHVFAPTGEHLYRWGHGTLAKPHSIWIGPDDEVLVADVIHHKVFIFSVDGTLRAEIAEGPIGPFCKPTWAVRSARGDLYVAGGYGQDCVHRLARGDDPGITWGEHGTEVGQFRVPHGIRVDSEERVIVIDRGNSRIQRFDRDGRFIDAWGGLGPANDAFLDHDDRLYVAECDQRVSILDTDGAVLGQLTHAEVFKDFLHGLWLDSRGSMYVCEVKATPNRLLKLDPEPDASRAE